jgi:hypothetical protein
MSSVVSQAIVPPGEVLDGVLQDERNNKAERITITRVLFKTMAISFV